MKENFEINIKWIIRAGIILALGIIIVSIFLDSKKDEYESKVLEYREQKDNYFKESEKSPIEDKENFNGLHYFEPDNNYKLKAELEFIQDSLGTIIKKNDGREDTYRRYAKAKFKLNGEDQSLTLFISPSENDSNLTAFVPFYDQTNGNETYSGGRYLDIKIIGKKEVIIDFNFAYNPFCVYSYKYSCPLPPDENYLDIPVMAGEKNWENKKEE